MSLSDGDLIHPAMPDQWPDLPDAFGALATTRRGGVSAGAYDDGQGGGGLNLGLHTGDDRETVQANHARLQAFLPGRPAWIAQVHGADVVDGDIRQPMLRHALAVRVAAHVEHAADPIFAVLDNPVCAVGDRH